MRFAGVLAAVLMLAAAVARGEPLDEDAAVARALDHDARLETLRAAVDLARAERRSAHAAQNPEVRLSYQETAGDDPLTIEDAQDYGVALRVFPSRPWQSRAMAYGGDANVQAALADLRAAEAVTTFETRQLYREILYLEKDLVEAQRIARVGRGRREALKDLAGQGQATTQDVLAAGVDHLEALSVEREVRRALRAAVGGLAELTGAGTAELKLAGRSRPAPPDPAKIDPAALEVFALEHRADLASVQWQMRRAWADYRAAKGLRVPWFSFIQGGYSQESAERDTDAWGASVGVDIPVFPDPQDNSYVKWAAYKQLRALEQETRERVVREVRMALDAFRDAAEQVREYERDAGPMIEALQDTLKDVRSQGGLGSQSAFDIEKRIASANRSRLAAENAFELALLALEAAAGGALPTDERRTLNPEPEPTARFRAGVEH